MIAKLFESNETPMLIESDDNIIRYCNLSFEKLFNFTNADIVGKKRSRLLIMLSFKIKDIEKLSSYIIRSSDSNFILDEINKFHLNDSLDIIVNYTRVKVSENKCVYLWGLKPVIKFKKPKYFKLEFNDIDMFRISNGH